MPGLSNAYEKAAGYSIKRAITRYMLLIFPLEFLKKFEEYHLQYILYKEMGLKETFLNLKPCTNEIL
jgi:hypothetical protein